MAHAAGSWGGAGWRVMQCAKFCWHGLAAAALYGTVVLKAAAAKRLSFTMQHQLNNRLHSRQRKLGLGLGFGFG